MRNIFLLAIAACVIAGLVPRFADRLVGTRAVQANPNDRAAAAPERAAPVSAGPRTVTIRRNRGGSFEIEGAVDGRHLDFIVDTGASVVTLNSGDAARLGFHPAERDYTLKFNTANGQIRGAPVHLDMVEVGGVMVRNVPAVVLPEEALHGNLLGLTFLSRLRRFEYRDDRLVLEE